MADQLVTPTEIADFLGVTPSEADRLATQATSLVQEATGQRLVEVVDDTVTVMGTTESWLALPEMPVSSVSSVQIDDEVVDDYKLVGSRLWRAGGWASKDYDVSKIHEPSAVKVVHTHGYTAGDQRLERARTAAFALAVQVHDNPSGAVGLSVDDYREQFGQSAGDAGVQVPESVAVSLRRYYGRKAGLVRLG